MPTAIFNRFEFEMPEQAVEECHHMGSCDEEVSAWQPVLAPNLTHIPDQDLAAELKEYGAWDDAQLQDRDDNEQRILWLAAGDIQDRRIEDSE